MRSDVRNTIIVPAGSSGNRTFWPKAPRCVSRIGPAGLPRAQHVAGLEPRLRAAVDHDDLVLADQRDAGQHGDDAAVDLGVRGARQEVELADVLFLHHIVADHGFALRLEHAQRAGIAGAIEAALADVDALIAEHVVGVGIDELLAELDDVEHGAYRLRRCRGRRRRGPRCHQAFAMRDDVRQIVDWSSSMTRGRDRNAAIVS